MPEQLAMSFSARAVASNQADLPPELRIDTRQWAKQLRAVYDVMKDGRWRTLEQITFFAGYKPNSIGAINARIRELGRKEGLSYKKRKAGEGRIYEYQLNKQGN